MADAAAAGPPDAGTTARIVGAGEFLRRLVARALARRRRYRYVHPEVRLHADGLVVVSPCCSRNVAPDGGVIAIAWLERTGAEWRLHRRDYAAARWVPVAEDTLPRLLEFLCEDPGREFWP